MDQEKLNVPVSGEKITITNQQVKWKAIEYPTLYTNVFTMSITPVDVAIVLGELDYATATEVYATPRVKLILAPEFAATLMNGIGNGVGIFIQANGPLRHNALPQSEHAESREHEG